MIMQARPNVLDMTDGWLARTEKESARRQPLSYKEAWLEQNAAAFATTQKALKMQSLSPAYSADGEFPSYAALRSLARAKIIESSTRSLRGDWNGAMQSRLDVIQMGNDTSRGGVLIGALVSFAIQAIGRKNLESKIEKLDATQARATAKRLENLYARRISRVEVMRAEKTFGQMETLKQMRDPQWRSAEKWAEFSLMTAEDVSWKDRLRMATVSK